MDNWVTAMIEGVKCGPMRDNPDVSETFQPTFPRVPSAAAVDRLANETDGAVGVLEQHAVGSCVRELGRARHMPTTPFPRWLPAAVFFVVIFC